MKKRYPHPGVLFRTIACLILFVCLSLVPQSGNSLRAQVVTITPSPTDIVSIKAVTQFGRGTISQISYSPNGKLLAVAGSLGVWLYQTNDLNASPRLLKDDNVTMTLAFSKDGLTMASGNKNGVIRLWDVATGTEISTLDSATGTVLFLVFSPDGHTLASNSNNIYGSVFLWDITGGKFKLITNLPERDFGIAFSPDGGCEQRLTGKQ